MQAPRIEREFGDCVDRHLLAAAVMRTHKRKSTKSVCVASTQTSGHGRKTRRHSIAVARELEAAVVELVVRILGADLAATPSWLLRPGPVECGDRWPTICAIYSELTGLELPERMPSRETRRVDAVLLSDAGRARVFEVDETQHFNHFRARTLRQYPDDVGVAFPIEVWIARSEAKSRLEGGGFGRPRPPLFPAHHGRHAQRAFRDSLADLLPSEHGWEPTLRIADFEVRPWIFEEAAENRMQMLLQERLVLR